MESASLTPAQAKKVNKALYPKLNYLFRLRQRMEKVGFPPNDPLYLLVERAYDAMQRLHVETHYLSCNGVGRPAKNDQEEAGEK